MIMDVDMHSPSFRTARTPSTSSKRPRSPPSPSPLERPSKRISFGVNNSVSLPLAHLQGGPPPLRARQPSEDWVTQTRGLRIEGSPSVEQGIPPSIPEEREQAMVDDVPMTMDNTEPSPYESNPFSCPQVSTEPVPYPELPYQNAQLLQQPASAFLPSNEFPIPSASHSAPAGFVSNAPHAPSLPMPASAASLDSSELSQPPATVKKQRFTMGPRMDCDKCRRGVKGHWMHFD